MSVLQSPLDIFHSHPEMAAYGNSRKRIIDAELSGQINLYREIHQAFYVIGNAQGADNSSVTNCAAANQRIYTEPYGCDIEWGLGLISGYISASGISMKDCHALNGIEIQRKKPGTEVVEDITPQDNETGNIWSDTDFTLTRYWGSQDATSLEDAKSKAGIGADI